MKAPTVAIDTAPNAADRLVKEHPDAAIVVVAVGTLVAGGRLSFSVLVQGKIDPDMEERMRADIARRLLEEPTKPGPRRVRIEE